MVVWYEQSIFECLLDTRNLKNRSTVLQSYYEYYMLIRKKKAIFLTCYCFKTRDCDSAVSAYTFTGPRAN